MCEVCGIELVIPANGAPTTAPEPSPADEVALPPAPVEPVAADPEPEQASVLPVVAPEVVKAPPASEVPEVDCEHTQAVKKRAPRKPKKTPAKTPGEPVEIPPLDTPDSDVPKAPLVEPWSEPEVLASEADPVARPAADSTLAAPAVRAPEQVVDAEPEPTKSDPVEKPAKRRSKTPLTLPLSTAQVHATGGGAASELDAILGGIDFEEAPAKRRSKKPLVIGAAILAGVLVLGAGGTAVVVNIAAAQAAADAAAEVEPEVEPPFLGWEAEPVWSFDLDPGATVSMLGDLLVTVTDTHLELRDTATGDVTDTIEVSGLRLWQLGDTLVGLADGEVLALDNDGTVHRAPADTTQARIRGTNLIVDHDGSAEVITPAGSVTIPAPTPEAKLLGATEDRAIWTTQGATLQTTSLTGEILSTVELAAPEGYAIGKWLGGIERYVAVTWVSADQTVLTLNDAVTGTATSSPLPLSPAEAEKPGWAVAVGNQPALVASVQMSMTTGATTPLDMTVTDLHAFGASVIGENAAGQQVLIDGDELRTLRLQEVTALGLTSTRTLIGQAGQTVFAYAPEHSPRKEEK